MHRGVIVDRDERYATEVYVSVNSSCLHPHRPTPLEFFETAKSLPPGQKTLFEKALKPNRWGKSRRQVLAETVLITQIFYNILIQKAFQVHFLVALASNNIITFLLIWYRRFRKQM